MSSSMAHPQSSPTNSALLSRMHSASRSEHASLNKAITARLPLCLPPNAFDPYLYAAGMTVFAQMYFTMESVWTQLLEDGSTDAKDRDMLETLKTQYLKRREHIESDLHNLRANMDVIATQRLDTLHQQAQHFRHAISASLLARPHLVIAYAWPMYLALFNGGRWIASKLLAAGPDFWHANTDVTSHDYLSFWYFDDSVYDEHHGENVKIDFKQKLNAVSELLTPAEEDEIIAEVKRVFGICTEMVTLLDKHAMTNKHEQAEASLEPDEVVVTTGWSISVTQIKSAWQSFRAIVGFAAPPMGLRKDFEQHP